MNRKSGQEVAKQKSGLAKSDSRFWQSRLFRNFFTRDGQRQETADWCVRIARKGRRETFNLETPNKEAASRKAQAIYLSLVANGWGGTLAIYKPSAAPGSTDAPVTLNDLMQATGQRAVHVRPTTLRYYEGCLRQIAADVASLKRPVDRHDYVNGGSTRWRAIVDALPLSVITPEALRQWQTAYVKSRGSDQTAIRSGKISANTILGSAARMFTPIMLDHYKDAGLLVPSNPFAQVKPFPKQDSRYISRIDPAEVLETARQELLGAAPAPSRKLTGIAVFNAARAVHDRPQAYRVILLGTLTGLRRSELDRLQWAHINFAGQSLTVQSTADGAVKAEGSTRDVDLESDLIALLKEWKASARSLYVIECERMATSKPAKDATYRTYRCARVFDKAADWLRAKFLPGENHPLHTLRKEYGSLITQSAGIHAAADLLGHRDIRTASEYYVVRKTRAFTGLSVPGAPAAVSGAVPETPHLPDNAAAPGLKTKRTAAQ